MQRFVNLSVVGVALALTPVTRVLAEQAKKPARNIIVLKAVEGAGTDRASALAAALRKAIEQGGKQEISSYSKAENYVLIRDTIYSRSEGIVTDYKVIKEEEGAGGVYYVTITAKVDKTAIATRWGEVQNVLDQIGRPKIMVYIKEKIDGRLQEGSILESKIEERLVKNGFDVVAQSAVEEIAKREKSDAAVGDDIKKIQAIAKNFHAQIYIVGHSNANFAEIANMYNVRAAMYNCDAVAKCYYTDTGRLLASESVTRARGGARGRNANSPQAGREGLANAGKAIIDKMYVTVMTNWSTQASAGGDVRIELSGAKYSLANKVKKRLAKLPTVRTVHMRFSKGIATYRIVAKKTGEEMAGILSEGEWEEIIEIEDVTLNRIQAKAVGGK